MTRMVYEVVLSVKGQKYTYTVKALWEGEAKLEAKRKLKEEIGFARWTKLGMGPMERDNAIKVEKVTLLGKKLSRI